MQRDQFEHVIAAAANVTGEDEFVVIGSQAIHGLRADRIPPTLLNSMEVDMYPRHDPAKTDAIDLHLGDGSMFHRTFGYYAHGVEPATATAPDQWQRRLVRVSIPPRPTSGRTPVAWCIAMPDLLLAKCAAGRGRDWEYAEASLRSGLVDIGTLLPLIPTIPIDPAQHAHIAARLLGIAGRVSVATRAPRPDEGERLREITVAAKGFWGYSREQVEEWAAAIDLSPTRLRRSEAVVAEVGGRVIGWAEVLRPNDGVSLLEHLWVEPGSMRTGVGSLLFQRAAERARALGAAVMEWEAEPNALGFYARMGGRRVRSTTSEWGRELAVMAIDLT